MSPEAVDFVLVHRTVVDFPEKTDKHSEQQKRCGASYVTKKLTKRQTSVSQPGSDDLLLYICTYPGYPVDNYRYPGASLDKPWIKPKKKQL